MYPVVPFGPSEKQETMNNNEFDSKLPLGLRLGLQFRVKLDTNGQI